MAQPSNATILLYLKNIKYKVAHAFLGKIRTAFVYHTLPTGNSKGVPRESNVVFFKRYIWQGSNLTPSTGVQQVLHGKRLGHGLSSGKDVERTLLFVE